jgi:hypothetical protein
MHLRKRVIAGVVASVMVSSLIAFPNLTHASGKINLADEIEQSYRIKTIQKIQRLVDRGNPSSTTTNTQMRSMAMKQNASQITFSNKISFSNTHIYKLQITKGGTVHVTSPSTQSQEIFYVILPTSAIDHPNSAPGNAYADGDSIPAGTYYFMVGTVSNTPVDYSFTVSGVTMSADSALPNLSVTNPTQNMVRLSKTATGINLSGSATGANETFYAIDASDKQNLNGTSFNQTIPLSVGHHDLQIGAKAASGNMVVHEYSVTRPGTIRLAGANRFEVSAKIGQRLINDGVQTDTAIIASGLNFPDTLSASSPAGQEFLPILQVTKDQIPAPIDTFIKNNHIKVARPKSL